MRALAPEAMLFSLPVQKEDKEAKGTLHMQRIHFDQCVDGRRRLAIPANDGWALRRLIGGVG